MNTAQLLFTSVVYGITLRVLGFDNRVWLTSSDLVSVLGSMTVTLYIHKTALEPCSAKARINGKGQALRLFDEAGVRSLCEHSKSPGAFHLLSWLDARGMHEEGAISPITARLAAKCDVGLQPPAVGDSNVVTLKAIPSRPPACQIERRKAYCRELLKTLLRYTSEDEAEELVQVIEGEVRNLLSHRHCPGLNDARYDVYRRFWLQGGDV